MGLFEDLGKVAESCVKGANEAGAAIAGWFPPHTQDEEVLGNDEIVLDNVDANSEATCNTCANCGTGIAPGDLYCSNCGVQPHSASVAAGGAPNQGAYAKPKLELKYSKKPCKVGDCAWYGCTCRRCGRVRDENHHWGENGVCRQCGATLHSIEQKQLEKERENRSSILTGLGLGLLLIIMTVLMGVMAYFEDSKDSEQKPTTIAMPLSSAAIDRGNYEDAVLQLEEAGFTNIQLVPLNDLIIGLLHDEGDVAGVSANGKTSFAKGDEFPVNSKIRISYHCAPTENKNEATQKNQGKSARNTGSITNLSAWTPSGQAKSLVVALPW